METRPSVWVNAEKACNLADCMEITLTISMLKHFETHITNIILLPQDHFLKRRTPSPDFVFTEDDFPYLPGSETPSKRQCIEDRTVSLGSPTPPPHFALDYDPDYFASVSIFLDHEPAADYIKQSLIWQCNMTLPTYFGSIKNIFTCSVPVGLHGLVASACLQGCNIISLINVHVWDVSDLSCQNSLNGFWTLVLQCTSQANDLT